MKVRFGIAGLWLGLLMTSVTARAQEQARPLTPIQSFLGVCQAGSAMDGVRKLGLGWEREDVHWGPDIDHPIDEESFKKQVLAAQARGVRILPILCYTAAWAAEKDSYDFDHAGIHYHVEVTKTGPGPKDYKRVRIGTDPATGKEVSRRELDGTRASPDPKAWAAYVEKCVSTFSRPPYNIKYWQVWNEGTFESGAFWDENIERYVDNVHIPAAKIIHKYGGKVVWGGWPDCNTLAEYDKALLYHDAWKYTDVVDVHYLSPMAFDYLYQRWVGTGRCQGIWMTEIGFTQNPEQIPNTYPRMLYWGLTHGFDDPDKYKVFWFAWWSPNDPKAFGYHCTLNSGDTLSDHGKQLAQFSELLNAEHLTAYSQFTTSLGAGFNLDERKASVEGFQTDDRYVFAFHIPVTSSDHYMDGKTGDSRQLGDRNRITLTLPEAVSGADRYHARVVPLPGSDPYDISPAVSGRDLVLTFAPPIHPGESALAPKPDERVFYVVVDK